MSIYTLNSPARRPFSKLKVSIEPVQSGSGDPSPTNVRPISGWTGVNVQADGKNLLDASMLSLFLNNRYVRTPNYNSNGSIKVKDNTIYTISFSRSITDGRVRFWRKDGTEISYISLSSNKKTFTTPDDCLMISFYAGQSESVASINDFEPQIELGSTATPYEPYKGKTITQQFKDANGNTLTVYGGDTEIVGGKLTTRKLKKVFDGTETFWVKSTTYKGSFFAYWANFAPKGVNGSRFICSHATFHSLNSQYAYGMCASDRSCSLFLLQDPNATVTDFKAYLANEYANGTPVEIVYELAEPLVYQLDPQQVNALKGINNIWADTGDVEEVALLDWDLVYDRTAQDVNQVNEFVNRIETNGYDSLTNIEKQTWAEDLKGALNASDLNRWGYAMNWIATELVEHGYSIQANAKEDWAETDIPNQTQASAILSKLAELYTALNDLFNYESSLNAVFGGGVRTGLSSLPQIYALISEPQWSSLDLNYTDMTTLDYSTYEDWNAIELFLNQAINFLEMIG